MRETHRDYAHPRRPWLIRAANRALAPWRGRLPPLDAQAMIAEAQRAEGLSGFDDPHPEPALRRLCAAMADEAALHPVGHLIARGRLVATLRHRLRAHAAATEAVKARPVTAPVVIVGLQRTGTTKLQRLLARDPQFRTLRSWEALQPLPRRAGDEATRIRQTHLAARGAQWLSPDFYAVHPMLAEDVEEDVLLLDASLLSTVAEATMRVPSYGDWLEQQDQTPGYLLHKRYLQLLQGPSERRWLLKTPHHLEWLDVLLAVYPDARILFTHRDPLKTVPSFCSMLAHGRGMLSDVVDTAELGDTWLRKTARMTARAAAVLERAPSGTVLDIAYDDVMGDPMGQVRRIYEFLDTPLSDQAAEQMEQALVQAPQHRFGRHVYDGRDFGLPPERIAEAFADHRSRYGYG